MDEVVFELGFPSVTPSESRMRKFQFHAKVWNPKVKFAVDFYIPPARPLSEKGVLETTKSVLSK
jgi:hypothetical protein